VHSGEAYILRKKLGGKNF